MTTGQITTHDAGAVRTISIDRPDRRNAFDGEMLVALADAVEDAGRSDALRVIVLQQLASRSPLALAAAKRAVNVGSEMDLRQGIRYVLQEFALLFAGEDQREGMSAFLEKREPDYTGR